MITKILCPDRQSPSQRSPGMRSAHGQPNTARELSTALDAPQRYGPLCSTFPPHTHTPPIPPPVYVVEYLAHALNLTAATQAHFAAGAARRHASDRVAGASGSGGG